MGKKFMTLYQIMFTYPNTHIYVLISLHMQLPHHTHNSNLCLHDGGHFLLDDKSRCSLRCSVKTVKDSYNLPYCHRILLTSGLYKHNTIVPMMTLYYSD